jgi:hypothetical protein
MEFTATTRPLARLLQVLRIDAELSVVIGHRGRKAGQIDGHWQNQTGIIVGMLADQVDAARSARDIR